MLINLEMEMKRSGPNLVLVLFTLLVVSSGGKAIKDLKNPNDSAQEDSIGNLAGLLWANCRHEMVRLTELYEDLDFSMIATSGANMFERDDYLKLLSVLPEQIQPELFNCLKEKVSVSPASGDTGRSSLWFLRPIDSLVSSSYRLRQPRRYLAGNSEEPSQEILRSPAVTTLKPSNPGLPTDVNVQRRHLAAESNNDAQTAIIVAVVVTAIVTFILALVLFMTCHKYFGMVPVTDYRDEKPLLSTSMNDNSVGSRNSAVLQGACDKLSFQSCSSNADDKEAEVNTDSDVVDKSDGKVDTLSVEPTTTLSDEPTTTLSAEPSIKNANVASPPLKPPLGMVPLPPPLPPGGDSPPPGSAPPPPGLPPSKPPLGRAQPLIESPTPSGIEPPPPIAETPPPGRVEPPPSKNETLTPTRTEPLPPSSIARAPPPPKPAPPSPSPSAPAPPPPPGRSASGGTGPPPPGPPPPPPGGTKPGVAPPALPRGGPGGVPPPGGPPRVPPGSGTKGVTQTSRAKLKPFFWDKVLANPGHTMVWHQIKAGSFQCNEEMMESLFGYVPPDKNKDAKPKESSSRNQPQFIQLIDSKKAQNLSILLRALNITTEEIRDALEQGNELPPELIETLLKMAPTQEEELKLRLFNGSFSQLGPAERFLKVVVDIPFGFKRMETLHFMCSLEDEVRNIKESFLTLEAACDELRNNRLFLKLLEAVLKTGNRMNDGTFRGGAQAFKLDTLLKLSDVKGADGKITLLHFVVLEIIRSEGIRAARGGGPSSSFSSIKSCDLGEGPDEDSEQKMRTLGLQVVSRLSGEMENVKNAAGLDGEILSASVLRIGGSMVKTRNFLNNEMQNVDVNNGFHQVLRCFVEDIEGSIVSLVEEEQRIVEVLKSTADYFHGKSTKEEGLRLFGIVRDFLLMLDKACAQVAENFNKAKANGNGNKTQVKDPTFSQSSSSTQPEQQLSSKESSTEAPAPKQNPADTLQLPPDVRQRIIPAIASNQAGGGVSSSDDEAD